MSKREKRKQQEGMKYIQKEWERERESAKGKRKERKCLKRIDTDIAQSDR